MFGLFAMGTERIANRSSIQASNSTCVAPYIYFMYYNNKATPVWIYWPADVLVDHDIYDIMNLSLFEWFECNAKVKRLNVLIPSRLGLLDGVSQIRLYTPRRGRYPFGKSERPPRPVPALSFEPQTNQALSPVA